MDNIERAYYALDALTAYLKSKGEPCDGPGEDYEISDLICDLLHHGDLLGLNHQDILDRAIMHYEYEIETQDQEQ
jgi:hypothetical protein